MVNVYSMSLNWFSKAYQMSTILQMVVQISYSHGLDTVYNLTHEAVRCPLNGMGDGDKSNVIGFLTNLSKIKRKKLKPSNFVYENICGMSSQVAQVVLPKIQ